MFILLCDRYECNLFCFPFSQKSSEENDDKVDVERPNRKHDDGDNSRKKVRARRDDEEREFYLKRRFVNVRTALNIFKDDELCSVPGR